MARARKQTKETTPGFAIKITPQTELGLAMLIAETEDGRYEPVAVDRDKLDPILDACVAVYVRQTGRRCAGGLQEQGQGVLPYL